jgi:predicted nucleic acid-binding protein
MQTKIYVDTCIFIAYYFEKSHPKFYQNYLDTSNCLEQIIRIRNIKLVTSDFTFTEFTKVAQDKKIPAEKVHDIVARLSRQKKIGDKYRFEVLKANGYERDYTFEDFFIHLQTILLKTRPGIADAIHYQIMRNNRINKIITLNPKDFLKIKKEFRNITVIPPARISEFI